eukprot:2947307-Pleurochrysis_carterae.AAC.1
MSGSSDSVSSFAGDLSNVDSQGYFNASASAHRSGNNRWSSDSDKDVVLAAVQELAASSSEDESAMRKRFRKRLKPHDEGHCNGTPMR